jgi:hypothetical protein
MGSRSPGYPIRQAVPTGLGFSFWAHLWAVLVGVIRKRGVGFRDTQAALGVSGDSKDVKDPKRPR